MDENLIDQVWQRANHACEYCHLPQQFQPNPFEIDHIISKQQGGRTVLSNLALSCLSCNCHKGPNIAGIDYATSKTKLVHLFHPRKHKWQYHFTWQGPFLMGKTPIGRVTVHVLAINSADQVELREELIEIGEFPPVWE